MKHQNATLNHVPYNFSFADETDREAGTGYTIVAADRGKFARQEDDNSIWMLTDESPITWVAVGQAPPTIPGTIRATVSRSTGQAIATGGSGSPISWTTEVEDTDGIWAVGNPTKLIIVTPGVYVFGGNFQWDAGSGGTFRYQYLQKNGPVVLASAGLVPTAGSGLATRAGTLVSYPVHMNATDYVELYGYHDNGSDRNLDNGIFWCFAIELD